jgi:hypothetical protein
MQYKCWICGRVREKDDCKVFPFTPEEKAQYGIAESEFALCKPCSRTAQDPIQGPQLIKGLWSMRLQRLGFANTDTATEKYKNWLISQAQTRKS